MNVEVPDTPLANAILDLEDTLLEQIAEQKISTKVLLQKVYRVKKMFIGEQGGERRTEGGIILG
ncbi:MAG: hypothetical protein ACYSTI_14175 [Planctomycetota bacterium]|jgi:hypothetical protein